MTYMLSPVQFCQCRENNHYRLLRPSPVSDVASDGKVTSYAKILLSQYAFI